MERPSEPAILALYDNEIHDLVPVAPPGSTIAPGSSLRVDQLGKIPSKKGPNGWVGFAGWPDAEISRQDIVRWVDNGAGFGLRTRNYPAIDCDVSNPRLAGELRSLLPRLLGAGPTPIRVGNPPKFVIACRTDAPFRKRKLTLTRADGTEAGAIELLGDRGHYVISGIHPKTGKPNTWHLGGRVGGVEVLAGFNAAQLPVLNEKVIEELLVPQITQWATSRGLSVNQRTRSAAARDVDQSSLRAPSIEKLREVMASVPNAPDVDRDEYLQVAAAVRAAAGPECETEGLEIFLDWSSKWEGGSDPEYDQRTFRSLTPPHSIGFGYLVSRARASGYDDTDDFTTLGDDVIVLDAVVAPPSEGERIAALIRIPDRAFMLEAATLEDGDLVTRWRALRAAAEAGDPLAGFFRTIVIPTASHAGVPADDPRRYAIVLDAKLQEKAAGKWGSLTPVERALLLRSAFALFANAGTLAQSIGDSPGLPLPLVAGARDDLVAGFIPSRSLAAIIGPAGQGKSFLGLELAARVAKTPATDELGFLESERFMGAEVQHGSVLYFASEGVNGWRARAEAWGRAHGTSEHLHLFGSVPPLTETGRALSFMLDAVEQVQRLGAPPLRLIVIDVLRAAISGEENSSEVMGAAMATAGVLTRMTGAAVVMIHHAGHADPERARGSSAFGAAMDFIGATAKRDNEITLTVTKNKDGEGGQQFRWHLDGNLLHEGGLASESSVEGMEAFARAAGVAIHSIAASGVSVSRTDLVAEMTAAQPALFGSAVNSSTARSRISRGINRAIESGWLVHAGNRFRIGENLLPLLEPSDLAGVGL